MFLERFVEAKDFKDTIYCFVGDKDNSIMNKTIKLSEEVGEVSSNILAYLDADNKSKSAVKDLEDKGKINAVVEEILDVILVADDLLEKIRYANDIDADSFDELCKNILSKKISKWKNKIKERR